MSLNRAGEWLWCYRLPFQRSRWILLAMVLRYNISFSRSSMGTNFILLYCPPRPLAKGLGIYFLSGRLPKPSCIYCKPPVRYSSTQSRRIVFCVFWSLSGDQSRFSVMSSQHKYINNNKDGRDTPHLAQCMSKIVRG